MLTFNFFNQILRNICIKTLDRGILSALYCVSTLTIGVLLNG